MTDAAAAFYRGAGERGGVAAYGAQALQPGGVARLCEINFRDRLPAYALGTSDKDV